MRRPSLVLSTLAIAYVGLIAACDNPTSNLPVGPTATGPRNISIAGPDTVSPGQSVQLLANLTMSDGTIKAATTFPNLRWRSSNSSVLQVTAAGVVTANQPQGEAVITAELTGIGAPRSTREMVILPTGTFRVVGFVREAESPTPPISGARVEVPGTSLATNTDANGQYRLYGVPAQSTLLVTANGYFSHEQNLNLTTNLTQNVFLGLSGPRLSLSGPYTLVIDAAGSCGSLPSGLRQRSYEAVLSQAGSTVNVVLTEPRFRLNGTGKGDRFTGRTTSAGATFTLSSYFPYYYYYYGAFSYPDVAERLSNGTFLVVQGQAVTAGSAAGLSGTLNGALNIWDSRFPTTGISQGGCSSSSHQFALTPR